MMMTDCSHPSCLIEKCQNLDNLWQESFCFNFRNYFPVRYWRYSPGADNYRILEQEETRFWKFIINYNMAIKWVSPGLHLPSLAVIVCSCWRALVKGRYSVIIIIKLEVNLKMTGWSKFAHTSGSIKLETFHECLKLEAVTPSVPVSVPGPGSLGHSVLVSSELSQTRLGPSQNQSKLSIFLMSVFRQTGLRNITG